MRSSELLQTKFQRPRIPHHYISRPRLLNRLDQGTQGPLTLVCAAAGHGKTTLVSAWAEARAAGQGASMPNPVIWISLDDRDGDLGLFLRYFIAGLRTQFTEACAKTVNLLQATRQPPFDVLCTTLINEVAALPQEFTLVLDDYHLISGTGVPNLFAEFQRHWPQPLHLVLISRYVPVGMLASMRAKGQLTEIRTRDLRFTPEETELYLKQVLPTPLSRPALELLERQTEGWIAGLQLAGLSLWDAKDPETMLANLSGLEVEFADFLMQDVLSHQPAQILSFLLQTAVLPQFCVTLCDVVVAYEDPAWRARRCIDWLIEHNLFVTSLDHRGEWYRCHQMLRNVLLARAAVELGSGQMNDQQRKAAAWFAQRGLMDEAISYALAAGDLDLAADFVDQGLCDLLNREDRPTLERWLALFPDDFVQARPGLLIIKGTIQIASWQIGALAKTRQSLADLLTRQHGTALPEPDPGIWRGTLTVLSAALAYHTNDPVRAEACSRETLALVPKAWTYIRSAGRFYLSLAMQATGQGQAAAQLLTEDYASLSVRTDTYALRVLFAHCFIQYVQAEGLAQLIQTARALVEGAERSQLRLLQSWGHYYLGVAHYQRNELAAARQSFVRLLEYRYTGHLAAVRDGVQRLALIHQIAGDQAEAGDMLDLLERLDLEYFGHETAETGALRARLWFMRGDLLRADDWADGFSVPVPDELPLLAEPPHLIKARILVARGTVTDVESALEILDALDVTVQRKYNVRLKIEILALRAIALHSQGKTGDAGAALHAAVDLARHGGFVRPFVDLGPPMAAALRLLARQEGLSGSTALHWLHAAFGDTSADPTPVGQAMDRAAQGLSSAQPSGTNHGSQPLIEPLTARELEILHLLRDPIGLKEVARQLVISPLTVRRHATNIYGKLGVNSRWDAVATAVAMGIIPPK